MKKLFKNLKIKYWASSALLLCLLSPYAEARSPIAVVQQVKGNVFMTSDKGRTVPVRAGQHIYDFSEITTTIGAEVSFNNYFDHKFHLAGAGQVKFLNKVVELRRGYLWLQVLGKNNSGFSIQTANAQVGMSPGEGVLSFDPDKDKTQFLSLRGKFNFGNLMDQNLNVSVRSGDFSYVDLEHRQGLPRTPTPVGQESFEKIVNLFDNVRPMDATLESSQYEFIAQEKSPKARQMAQRKPASVEGEKGVARNSSIRFLPLEHSPELQKGRESLIESYREPAQKAPKRAPAKISLKKSDVQVNIYGVLEKKQDKPAQKKQRSPASVKASREVEKIIENARIPASVSIKKQSDNFEKSLLEEYKKQKRHSTEVNQLIDDLKSYKQDYQKGH